MSQANSADAARALPHRSAPKPLHFPEDSDAPETLLHLLLRTLLFQALYRHCANRGSVGSEQFVYFNAADPKKCRAPDAFVKLGVAQEHFSVWKTWERGVPELAVEIASATKSCSCSSELSTLDSRLSTLDCRLLQSPARGFACGIASMRISSSASSAVTQQRA